LQGFAEPVGVITTICQQSVRIGQADDQSGSASIITNLACRHEEADGASIVIGDGMQLGVHAALRATDQPTAPPFFTLRLVAVRWALR